MNLATLKTSLAGVMPLLDANLAAAHAEYMEGSIAAGAFGFVRTRHETAAAVLAREDIPEETAFKACSLLAIDLRSAVKDAADPVAADASVQAWWQCYRDAGFTEVHKHFDFPIRPDGAVLM